MIKEDKRERRVLLGSFDLEFESRGKSWPTFEALLLDLQREVQPRIDTCVEMAREKQQLNRVELTLKQDFVEDPLTLNVYGYRFETDKEMAARQRRAKTRQEREATERAEKEAKERRELERLKAKYG